MRTFYVHSQDKDNLRKIAQQAIVLGLLTTMKDVEQEIARGRDQLHWSVESPKIEEISTKLEAYVSTNNLGIASFLSPNLPRLAVGLCPLIAGLLILCGCASVPTWSTANEYQRQMEFFKADQSYLHSVERQISVRASADTINQLKADLCTR